MWWQKTTNRQTDRHTHGTTIVTLAAHVRRGLIIETQTSYYNIFKFFLIHNTHFCSQKVEFRFGTELFENPIEHIQFYSKNDSNRIFSLRKEQVSS